MTCRKNDNNKRESSPRLHDEAGLVLFILYEKVGQAHLEKALHPATVVEIQLRIRKNVHVCELTGC